MLDVNVEDGDMELDSVFDSLVEADRDVDADGDELLVVVSEVLSEGEALDVGVTSDDDDTDVLRDSLLDGV